MIYLGPELSMESGFGPDFLFHGFPECYSLAGLHVGLSESFKRVRTGQSCQGASIGDMMSAQPAIGGCFHKY